MPEIRLATPSDLPKASQLYREVCEHQACDAYSPAWTWGVYPTERDIEARLGAGELYLAEQNGRLVGAMVLTQEEDPEYQGFSWSHPAEDDQVCVIHLLASHPDARGQGVGDALVRQALVLARSWGKRALHLDVLPGNLSANALYERSGFVLAGHHMVHYDDIGDTNLEMYECFLSD